MKRDDTIYYQQKEKRKRRVRNKDICHLPIQRKCNRLLPWYLPYLWIFASSHSGRGQVGGHFSRKDMSYKRRTVLPKGGWLVTLVINTMVDLTYSKLWDATLNKWCYI
ncbi:hypothetical protein TNCV_750951 [Trichonephila clavipes]|nr:hypothetical protein TNCV_750951 [Trichonephila clavipes]